MVTALRTRSLRRLVVIAAVLAVVITLTPTLLATPVSAAPVADDAELYQACGRVFPDPQAYWPAPRPPVESDTGQSPWAKGNENCRAVDFISWQEAISGLNFLASDEMFSEFVEVYDLSDPEGPFADLLDLEDGEGQTAGLPTATLERDHSPLYLIRVTDEASAEIPIEEREHFVYSLSIHGNERAGVEGGIRAVEDLATWAHCERHGQDGSPADCAQENAGPENPHPVMETLPEASLTAGDALRKSSVWFVLANPDGWRRGDKQKELEGQEPGYFYMRYNGNGMDMNRDWPAKGFTFRPYTPWSEPETRSFGKVLKAIKDTWTGGIDLHGQLIDRAFSFTLIGASERPYAKDRRVLQFVKGAFADAETRLAWSPLIKPNDAPPSCVEPGLDPTVQPSADCDPSNRIYGVQWGTIWDTIDYTVTGAMGDWFDSPIGLGADGIDNEMSMSHLSNCGTGNCFEQEFEQLHVDGNKSLIYAMMHYSLQPEETTFRYDGEAAYLYNPRTISDAGQAPDTGETQLPAQEDDVDNRVQHSGEGNTTYPFDVQGPADGVHNGGLTAKVTFSNVGGVSGSVVSGGEVAVDRKLPGHEEDENPQDAGGEEGWEEMNSYFNQAGTYAQSGARVDVNVPPPGHYRVRITGGGVPSEVDIDVLFSEGVAWPDPGQRPFEATNMDFFEMLQEHVPSADKLTKVPIDDVLSGAVDLRWFDTVIAADDAVVPGYVDPDDQLAAEAQETHEDSVTAPPGAPVESPATTATAEFDVEVGNASLSILAVPSLPADIDLYLRKQKPDGSYSGNLASGASGSLTEERLLFSFPQPGHYRLVVHNWSGSPTPVELTFTYYNEDGESGPGSDATIPAPFDRHPEGNVDTQPTKYGAQARDAMASELSDFAEQGGNVVLTDDSLRALEWMGLVEPGTVRRQAVYTGHVEFTADNGETSTYEDPLAANVDQPGAAEGPNHRHQVSEPVPIGYAIQDVNGNDFNSVPQWGIERSAWEDAGGRVVGVFGVGDVTLGELELGDGRVRVLGSLLTFPTDKYDHPFGVDSYGLTYTGYELARNLLSWKNPHGTVARPAPQPEPTEEPAPAPLPTTGGGPGPWALIALAGAVMVAVRLRRRVGTTWILG